MEIIKAGSTELTRENTQEIYNNNKYVCNYSGIYKPVYNDKKNSFSFKKVVNCKGYANRGRFFIQTAEQVNYILGDNVL